MKDELIYWITVTDKKTGKPHKYYAYQEELLQMYCSKLGCRINPMFGKYGRFVPKTIQVR